MNGPTEKPTVYCFAALTYGQGHVWGEIRHVSLETAEMLKENGYAIVGPDPDDLCELAKWEKEQRQRGYWT